LGALYLHRSRILNIADRTEAFLNELWNSIDGSGPLPDMSAYDNQCCIDNSMDSDFGKKCSLLIREVVQLTKRERNPLDSVWEDGLPLFICGGGKEVPFYKNAIASLESAMTNMNGFLHLDLPRPSYLKADDLADTQYHRLGVAFGLSHSKEEVGEITPQSKIDDFRYEPQKPDLDRFYVSKDMC